MLIDFLRRMFARNTVKRDAASQPSATPAPSRPPPPRPAPRPEQRAAPRSQPPQAQPATPSTQAAAPRAAQQRAPATPATTPTHPQPVVRPAGVATPASPVSTAAGKIEARAAVPPPVPLKPGQRRLALRDERLAPKRASLEHIVTARRPQKQYFSGDEAGRLFSATLRTHQRSVRDLVTDEAQLARYRLPVWPTEQALAAALELELKALRHFSMHSARDR
ncbi:MAG TPA: hypothetical protein VMH26_09145, partial [Burkholderiales bacterium]|nr:hypothetical protein [Burkholderiales bacterium]